MYISYCPLYLLPAALVTDNTGLCIVLVTLDFGFDSELRNFLWWLITLQITVSPELLFFGDKTRITSTLGFLVLRIFNTNGCCVSFLCSKAWFLSPAHPPLKQDRQTFKPSGLSYNQFI